MNTREESRAKRDETQTDRQRAAHWLWGGLVALAAVFAALSIAILVHGATAGRILRGVEIAAVALSIGLFFRSAVLYERAKSSNQDQ
jgi:hypothetical protein